MAKPFDRLVILVFQDKKKIFINQFFDRENYIGGCKVRDKQTEKLQA